MANLSRGHMGMQKIGFRAEDISTVEAPINGHDILHPHGQAEEPQTLQQPPIIELGGHPRYRGNGCRLDHSAHG